MPFNRTLRIGRRLFTLIAVGSAIAWTAVALCFVRTRAVSDEWQIYRWNPSNLTFTETRVHLRGGGMLWHRESTTALPSDNTSALVTTVGAANQRLVHHTSPADAGMDYPWLWGDHYRTTPSIGINRSGLSDCWTIELRLEIALLLFGIAPPIWTMLTLRRWRRNRATGFAVVLPSGGEPSAGETAPA